MLETADSLIPFLVQLVRVHEGVVVVIVVVDIDGGTVAVVVVVVVFDVGAVVVGVIFSSLVVLRAVGGTTRSCPVSSCCCCCRLLLPVLGQLVLLRGGEEEEGCGSSARVVVATSTWPIVFSAVLLVLHVGVVVVGVSLAGDDDVDEALAVDDGGLSGSSGDAVPTGAMRSSFRLCCCCCCSASRLPCLLPTCEALWSCCCAASRLPSILFPPMALAPAGATMLVPSLPSLEVDLGKWRSIVAAN